MYNIGKGLGGGEQMLKIGEFSKLTKTTVKALRYYDKIGLLKPAFIDSYTNYRYYTQEQIQTAQQIQTLKAVGLTCEKIQDILQNKTNTEAVLVLHKQELEHLKEEVSVQLKRLDFLINPAKKQSYHPIVEKIPEYMVYSSKSYIKSSDYIFDFIKLTLKELKKTNPDVGFPEPDYCCIIYPDKNYRETDIFVEYAQSVDKKGVDTPVIKFRTLEGITAVSVTHYGGYENLYDAYISAVKYATENGYEICGTPRERYLKGVWNSNKKEEWETVIQIPVKEKDK